MNDYQSLVLKSAALQRLWLQIMAYALFLSLVVNVISAFVSVIACRVLWRYRTS